MKKVFAVGGVALMLSACVSTSTQVVVGDQEYAMSRTAIEKLEDFAIERRALQNINEINGLELGNHRVAVNAFRSDVLLTGEVPTEAIKTEIGQIIDSIREVGQVYNYLTVSEPKGHSHTLHEQYLKGKIDGRLFLHQKDNVKPSQYLVVVRDDKAYVMGVMTKAQQEEIVGTIRNTDGLKGVSLLNSLVQVDFDGLNAQVSNMAGDLKTVNANNRLLPLPMPAPKLEEKPKTVSTEPAKSENKAVQVQTGDTKATQNKTTQGKNEQDKTAQDGNKALATQTTAKQPTAQQNSSKTASQSAQTTAQTAQNASQATQSGATQNPAQTTTPQGSGLTDNLRTFPNIKHNAVQTYQNIESTYSSGRGATTPVVMPTPQGGQVPVLTPTNK